MKISVFCGVSIDGFLARDDGGLDYLAPFEGEEHGYTAFMASIDAIVVGRVTYDTVLAFPEWPYGEKRVVVLTHRPLAPRHGETTYEGVLAPLAARLAAEGVRRVYLDGGIAIRQALAEDLVDDMTISTVPRTIGSGRPLFGGIASHTHAWELVEQRRFPSGLAQARYERRK